MKSLFKTILFACAVAAMGSAAAAPVLELNAGVLTGARGVTFEGETYDIKFLDGACAAVHGTCANEAFVFRSQVQALDASKALLAQVFVDGPLGAFDADISLTTGCSGRSHCNVLTAFAILGGGWVDNGVAVNLGAPYGPGENMVNRTVFRTDFDTATSVNLTWAVWSKAAADVPEPGSIALFGLALAAMGTRLRRRRNA